MAYILCYIKPGEGTYPDHNYPGHVAHTCDWEHAMHLAISEDGRAFKPLRNNTGILFARCTFDEGDPRGTTKTLIDPWLFRSPDGAFMVAAVRRNRNAPDPRSSGCVMLFKSSNLVRFEERGFLRLSSGEIRNPRMCYQPENNAYYVEWREGTEHFCGYSKGLTSMLNTGRGRPSLLPADGCDIEGCIPGNVIEVSQSEAAVIRAHLDEIQNTGVEPICLRVSVGASLDAIRLPGAICRYSDGSSHEKPVDWDKAALARVDTSAAGEYEIPGLIRQKRWSFPMKVRFGDQPWMSDPCVTRCRGAFYLSSTGGERIMLRRASTPEGTFGAKPIVIYSVPQGPGEASAATWAAELHEIDGTPFLFTAICPGGEWTKVEACVLRCHGDPYDPDAWEAPRMCVKPDGSPIADHGISLDMTYFRDAGTHYVMWSNRRIRYGTVPLIAEPADIRIATVDPSAPWRLTCEPVCVTRPEYGWDRCETEVDEAPYLLRRADDLFITLSCSSTGMSDLYCVGLLMARSGANLLEPSGWERLPFPILTKESVIGQYGPGHNSFFKDPDTGDDIMVYHAVPHDGLGRALGRQPGLRRVHWGASGLPYLEMTPERDLRPGFERVNLRLIVDGK